MSDETLFRVERQPQLSSKISRTTFVKIVW